MGRQRWLLGVIVALVAASVFTLTQIPIKLGLDLQGGSQLTIQVKPTEQIKTIGSRELEAVQMVIDRRINGLGVSEPVVQTVGQDQVLVQLPGVTDPEQAERVLGGTAQLEFREQHQGTEGIFQAEYQNNRILQTQVQELRKVKGDPKALEDLQTRLKASNKALLELFDKSGIVGKNLQDAFAASPPGGNVWVVDIRFDTEGGNKFAEMTKRLAGTGRSIGIFLDDGLISAPIVGPEHAATGITGGGATITGNFTAQSAQELAIQLKGGSLPVPIEIVENRTVGATLGRDSIERSIYAGLGGLSLVLLFMVVYYRLPGAIASISLIIYSILSIAAFDLLGVTLTLPGIAGFILSIGMAVDANVLIFERTREELRAGKTLYRSVESGFYRAFSSILDSNVTTLIACAALFWLGTGLVKGFALTLALGVVVSMFTAITCSRTLLMTALNVQAFRKPSWYCPGLTSTTNSSKVEAAS
ncbi:MAG: protein-export membrane protein SecD [Alkalinema sp. CACIAM 70d]|nr:MAG: protein-export membrane protein SecD [Alkalinema sp. CACIAM 70d]